MELPGSHGKSLSTTAARRAKGTRKTVAWNQFVGTIMLLYALTYPVGAIPVFLAMTGRAGAVKTHRIIVLACAAVAVFFIGSAMFGKEILAFFNLGLDDFRIAGGLLVLVIAFEMFQAQYGSSFLAPTRQTIAKSTYMVWPSRHLRFPCWWGRPS